MNTTTLKSHTLPPRTLNCQLHTIGPTMDLANPQFCAPMHSLKKLVTRVCVSGYLCYVNFHQPLTRRSLSKKPWKYDFLMNTTTLKSHTQPPRTPNCQLHTIGPTMDLPNP